VSRNLSTAEVSRIVGLSEARVRQLVRAGLCGSAPRGRRYAFGFQDLVVLRAAAGLLAHGVPLSRVRRALVALVAELPDDRPLSGLRIHADGRHVAVRDASGTWQPETGQALLDFEVDEVAELLEAARRDRKPDDSERVAIARSEFETALELEDEDPGAAAEAYGRSLELDPSLVDAYVNLGRLALDAGDAARAAAICEHALEQAPDDPLIRFNLALALEDTLGPEAAAAQYERALSIDEDFAEAHFNLAALCDQLGRESDAIRHYSAYQRLTDRS